MSRVMTERLLRKKRVPRSSLTISYFRIFDPLTLCPFLKYQKSKKALIVLFSISQFCFPLYTSIEVVIDRLYKKYMAEVDEHAALRKKYFDEASKAHDKGDGKLAKELSDKGKTETGKMEEAKEKAARAIYKCKYDHLPRFEIDEDLTISFY